MDLSQSIEPNSAQINAEDLLSSPRTVTVTGVEGGTAEQPIFIHVQEFPDRTYRPSKTARRLIVACWGPDTSVYTGRKLTLFRNPEIRFGSAVVGGIEVSHASHIDKAITVALAVSRGKRKNFTVNVLETPAAPDLTPILAAIHTAPGLPELQAAWGAAGKAGVQSHPDVIAAKDARKGELSA